MTYTYDIYIVHIIILISTVFQCCFAFLVLTHLHLSLLQETRRASSRQGSTKLRSGSRVARRKMEKYRVGKPCLGKDQVQNENLSFFDLEYVLCFCC